MIGHDDFDRTLADWFEADARSPVPAGGLDRVIDATRRRRPRPAWLADLGSHWVGETRHAGSSSGVRSLIRFGLRWSTALILLLVLVALVGGAILVGARLLQPAPLPTGRLGHLAYGLGGDIYVADWDGRNPVRIAHALPDDPAAGCGTFWGEGPMWSPDGRHLAYRSDCGTVYVSDPDGHPVTSFPSMGWLVSWSPDSTRVATWVELEQTVGIYGLDGVRQALLTVPPGCPEPGDNDPVWSPDGKSVVIHSCEVPLDGRSPRRLPADDPRSHTDRAYSSDGARVAYTTPTLVVAATDGSHPRVLIPSGVTSPVWSPTGDRIAFVWSADAVSYDLAGNPLPRTYELRVVDVASGTVTSVTSGHGTDSLRVIKFLPEGDRILFSVSAGTTVGATSVWSVSADGSNAKLLVTGTGWGDFDWQWLPAGP